LPDATSGEEPPVRSSPAAPGADSSRSTTRMTESSQRLTMSRSWKRK